MEKFEGYSVKNKWTQEKKNKKHHKEGVHMYAEKIA